MLPNKRADICYQAPKKGGMASKYFQAIITSYYGQMEELQKRAATYYENDVAFKF